MILQLPGEVHTCDGRPGIKLLILLGSLLACTPFLLKRIYPFPSSASSTASVRSFLVVHLQQSCCSGVLGFYTYSSTHQPATSPPEAVRTNKRSNHSNFSVQTTGSTQTAADVHSSASSRSSILHLLLPESFRSPSSSTEGWLGTIAAETARTLACEWSRSEPQCCGSNTTT